MGGIVEAAARGSGFVPKAGVAVGCARKEGAPKGMLGLAKSVFQSVFGGRLVQGYPLWTGLQRLYRYRGANRYRASVPRGERRVGALVQHIAIAVRGAHVQRACQRVSAKQHFRAKAAICLQQRAQLVSLFGRQRFEKCSMRLTCRLSKEGHGVEEFGFHVRAISRMRRGGNRDLVWQSDLPAWCLAAGCSQAFVFTFRITPPQLGAPGSRAAPCGGDGCRFLVDGPGLPRGGGTPTPLKGGSGGTPRRPYLGVLWGHSGHSGSSSRPFTH